MRESFEQFVPTESVVHQEKTSDTNLNLYVVFSKKRAIQELKDTKNIMLQKVMEVKK